MEPTQKRADGFYYNLGRYFEGRSRHNTLETLIFRLGFNIKDGLARPNLERSKERSGYFGGGFFRGYYFIIEEATKEDSVNINALKRACDALS